ncbi:MAG TPA: PA2169 family four-helix-bundle protein [Blastocatellia bacterium]|nr:PA2169 family four-helix-bundle protein [Blastocatellia bacterium]
MADIENAISTLNGLIVTCRDGQEGFEEAAANVNDPELKQLFAEASIERSRMVGELQHEVRLLGAEPEDSGSVAGSLHRAWIEIKGTLTGKDEAAILRECERGEDSALAAYRRALSDKLPSDVRTVVKWHADAVKAMHDNIRSRRDQAVHA